MKLSVIIRSGLRERRRLLSEALMSVANQTLDREKYEVVVVKNYEDKEVDDIIAKQGYLNVLVNKEKPTTGKLTKVGIEK